MDFFRRLMQGLKMSPSDEELGRRSAIYPADPRDPRKSISGTGEEVVANLTLETSPKLMEFRMLEVRATWISFANRPWKHLKNSKLTGVPAVTTHPSFKAPRGFNPNNRPIITTSGRPAPNQGIYTTVVDSEIKMRKNHKRFSALINLALGFQIILAAALTALGASHGSHTAVTVFGGLNTVIAGFLTFLKGSGLPHRLKYFQHEWGRLREYIDQRERDLCISNNDIDIYAEVTTIRTMFEGVRSDVEANTPDRFVSNRTGTIPALNSHQTSGSLANLGSGKVNGLLDGLRDARSKVDGMHKDFGHAEKEVEQYASYASSEAHNFRGHMMEDILKMKNRVEDKMREVAHLEKQIEEHGKHAIAQKQLEAEKAVVQKTSEAEKIVGDKAEEIGQLEKDIGSHGRTEISRADGNVTAYAREIGSGAPRVTIELKNDPFREDKL